MKLERNFILKTTNSFFICLVDRDQHKTHESSRRKHRTKIVAFRAVFGCLFWLRI